MWSTLLLKGEVCEVDALLRLMEGIEEEGLLETPARFAEWQNELEGIVQKVVDDGVLEVIGKPSNEYPFGDERVSGFFHEFKDGVLSTKHRLHA